MSGSRRFLDPPASNTEMSEMRNLHTLILVVTLTGCASRVWYNPNYDIQQTRMDLGSCRLSAEQQRNSGLIQLPSWQTNVQRDKLFEDCMQSKGYYLVERNQTPDPANWPK
jgi:hypothetical protein